MSQIKNNYLKGYWGKFSHLPTDVKHKRWTSATIVLLSTELRTTINVTGHLQTLESRAIIGAAEQVFWSNPDSLEWHRQNVFRKS